MQSRISDQLKDNMKRSLTLEKPLKILFYAVFGLLFVSGLVVFLLKNNMTEPMLLLKQWLMKLHGASAMGSLLILGWMIPAHIQIGWMRKKNVKTGSLMIGVCAVLIVSGYGLYYFGDEMLRIRTSWIHSILGCLLPVLLGWHIRSGRQKNEVKDK